MQVQIRDIVHTIESKPDTQMWQTQFLLVIEIALIASFLLGDMVYMLCRAFIVESLHINPQLFAESEGYFNEVRILLQKEGEKAKKELEKEFKDLNRARLEVFQHLDFLKANTISLLFFTTAVSPCIVSLILHAYFNQEQENFSNLPLLNLFATIEGL